MKLIVALCATTTLAFAVPAVAQTTTTTTVTETTTVEVPSTVRTYVTEQTTPSVVLEGELVAGEVLPETVEVIAIPDQPEYGYAIVNDRRVILDPTTRTVIEVYN